jgi:hypothetical protein
VINVIPDVLDLRQEEYRTVDSMVWFWDDYYKHFRHGARLQRLLSSLYNRIELEKELKANTAYILDEQYILGT